MAKASRRKRTSRQPSKESAKKRQSAPNVAADTPVEETTLQDERGILRRYGIDAALILFGILHAFLVSVIISPTYDEGKHIVNGIAYLENRTCCLSDESPFSALHALGLDAEGMTLPPFDKPLTPTKGTTLYHDNADIRDWIRITSRISSNLMFGLTLLVVALWLRRIASVRVSRIGVLIAALCPNLLAYATIASTDIHLTAMVFLSLYLLLRFHERQRVLRILAVSVALGATLLTKFSALLFLAAFYLLFIAVTAISVKAAVAARRTVAIRYAGYWAILILVPLLLLNLGYFFEGTFSTLKDFDFRSESMTDLKASAVGAVPLPLPAGVVKAMDHSRRDAESKPRKSISPGYLFGRYYPEGNPFYHLAALGVKTSTAILILFVIGLVFYFRVSRPLSERLILLLCPILLFVFVSLFDRFNNGIRYILPIFPMMIIVAAYAFTWDKWRRIAWAPLLMAGAAAFNFPNYIAYFNVSSFVWDKEDMLIDSNLDWGQMDYLVPKDMAEHGVTKACPKLLAPNPGKRLNIEEENFGRPQACTYYLSKSSKHMPRALPIFRLMGKPDRVIADVIDVFEVKNEKHFDNAFVNRWEISDPFPAKKIKEGTLAEVSRMLKFKAVSTTFGYVDLNTVYPGKIQPDMCVFARSADNVTGNVLMSSTGPLFLIDKSTGKGMAAVNPTREIRFYSGSVPLPTADKVYAIICVNSLSPSFTVGYLPAP